MSIPHYLQQVERQMDLLMFTTGAQITFKVSITAVITYRQLFLGMLTHGQGSPA